jgi:hypothetical protein
MCAGDGRHDAQAGIRSREGVRKKLLAHVFRAPSGPFPCGTARWWAERWVNRIEARFVAGNAGGEPLRRIGS